MTNLTLFSCVILFWLFLKFVSYESETYEAEAEIYTLGEGPWRSLGRVPFHPDSQSFYASLSGALDWFNHSFYASLNGAFHWLTFDRASPDFIHCFDFDSEWFCVVCEPPEFGTHHKKEFPNRTSLGVLRDSLFICDFSSPVCVEIWMMKDYGIKESWTKEFVIGNGICKRGQLDKCEPIMILESGEILMLVNKNALVEYNPKLLEIALQKIVDSCCESSLCALPVVPTMEECMAKLSSMPQFSQNNEMRVKCRSLFADSDHRALFMACPDDERRYYFIHQACPVTIKECMAKLSSIPEFSRNSELWARGANLFRHSKNQALFMACPDDEKSCYFIMHGIAEEAEQRNNNSGLHPGKV